MPDYQKGKIYKLTVDEDPSLVYYGSTTQQLCERLAQHGYEYKYASLYYTSHELFKVGKVMITLVEQCPCNSKEELQARERHWIENNPCVNRIVPLRTKAEYYQDNKEDIAKQHKQYYEANKGAALEQIKQYREANRDKIQKRRVCECGKESLFDHKSRHERSEKHMKWAATHPISTD